MAYTRQKKRSMPVPGADPGVLNEFVALTTGETNYTVPVPWDGCKLVHCSASWVALDTMAGGGLVGDCEIDLELDSAGGTELMTITVASDTAVGTVTEGTFSNEDSCGGLDSANNIIIEVDGAAGSSVAGGMNVRLYFEPDSF